MMAYSGSRLLAPLRLHLGPKWRWWSTSFFGRLNPGRTPLPIGRETGWVPEPVSTCLDVRISFAPTGTRTPFCPCRIIFAEIRCILQKLTKTVFILTPCMGVEVKVTLGLYGRTRSASLLYHCSPMEEPPVLAG